MTLVAILGKSLAAQEPAILVGRYEFRNPGKRLGKQRYFVAEVDQEIAGLDGTWLAAYQHRRHLSIVVATAQLMWHETAVAKCPKQFVKVSGIGTTLGVYVYAILESIRFFSQSAGQRVARAFIGTLENVKIYSRHIE